jgi:pyrophosphatase PpaX
VQGSLAIREFRAVLFDVDGTLVDSLEMIVAGLGDTFEWYSGFRPERSYIESLMGIPLRDQMRLFSLHEPTSEELDARVEYALAAYQRHAHREAPFGAAIEALRHVAKTGRKVALVTSRNQTEVDHLMSHFPAPEAVDVIVCASDVTHPKPHPESAFLACNKLGIEPADAVFVGDSIFDLQCARDAQMARVAVLYGAGRAELLRAENPDLIVETPEQLLHWVNTTDREPCLDARN